MESLTWLDIIGVLILGWGIFQGIRKGFVVMIFSLIAIIAGIWATLKFTQLVAEWIVEKYEISASFSVFISAIVLFVGVLILVHLLARVIDRMLKAVALGWLNRLAGALLGLIKNLLALSLLVTLLDFMNEISPVFTDEFKENSIVYKASKNVVPKIYPLADDIKEYLKEKKEEVNSSEWL